MPVGPFSRGTSPSVRLYFSQQLLRSPRLFEAAPIVTDAACALGLGMWT